MTISLRRSGIPLEREGTARRRVLEREILNTQRRLGRLLLKSYAAAAPPDSEHALPEPADQMARLLALKIRDLRAELAAIERAERSPLIVAGRA